MKSSPLASSILIVVACLAAQPLHAADFDASSWLHGADGLYEAIRAVETETRPVVVYFYTDWCGYCRQFERELLSHSDVTSYLANALTVRINPERGRRERQIADYYGVHGYPGFFVRGQRSKTLARVERMKIVDGRAQLLSPQEFVTACREATTR
jgi:thiol:disulfide interchange protein